MRSAPTRSRMLILDEPTESLGVDATRQLYAHLRTLTAAGVSVLLISHRMHEVLAHADRVAVMKDGRVVEAVAASATSECEPLLASMGGEVHADTATIRRVPELVRRRSDVARDGIVARIAGGPVQLVAARRARSSASPGSPGRGRSVLLRRLWARCAAVSRVTRRRAYVPGDRQTSRRSCRCGASRRTSPSRHAPAVPRRRHPRAERKRALCRPGWSGSTSRAAPRAAMTALSGGNQQKVIVARAFATDAAPGAARRPVPRRRRRDEERALRTDARRGRRGAARSSGTRPRTARWRTATASTSSAPGGSSPSSPAPRSPRNESSPIRSQRRARGGQLDVSTATASFPGRLERPRANAVHGSPALLALVALIAIFVVTAALQPGILSVPGLTLMLMSAGAPGPRGAGADDHHERRGHRPRRRLPRRPRHRHRRDAPRRRRRSSGS